MAKAETRLRKLELRFDVFGWRALSERAREGERRVEDVLAEACLSLCAMLASSTPPPRPPRFKPPAGAAHPVAIELPSAVWEALEATADRAQLPLERIVEHAAFVELATEGPEPGGEEPSGSGGAGGARFISLHRHQQSPGAPLV